MKISIILNFILIISISKASSYVSSGKCIDSPVISDFNPVKYVGDWYEILRFPVTFEDGLKCVKAHYELVNETTVSVYNFAKSNKTGKNETVIGLGVIKNAQAPNHLNVYFPFLFGFPAVYELILI